MAKAIAICTCAKCGKQFEKTAVKRNRREADSWEEWAVAAYTTCPECEQAEREKEAERLADEAKEAGLPALTGSHKQVVWAEQIRGAFLESIDKFWTMVNAGQYGDLQDEKTRCAAKRFDATLNYILSAKREAAWWIDNRAYTIRDFVRLYYREAEESVMLEEPEKPAEPQKEIEPEEVVMPENQKYGTASVTVEDGLVSAKYPKDETFRNVVKGAGFTWNRDREAWEMAITEFTGSAEDRAADVASRLLRAGFAVACTSKKVLEMAVGATFQPKQDLWIRYVVSGPYADWLCIWLPDARRERDQMYQAARRIRGAVYRSGHGANGRIYVPMANHALVEDFAEINGYNFSTAARDAMQEYEAQRINAVAPAEPKKHEQADKLQEILRSDDAILPDLVDANEANH